MKKSNDNKEILVYGVIITILIIIAIGVNNYSTWVINLPTLENGNMPVAIQDQNTEIIDLRLSEIIAEINITSNTSIGQNWILIESNTLPIVDDLICLKEKSAFYQANLLSVTALGGNNYNVSLDKPLDYAFTLNGGCSIREDNWAVSGSLSNPRTFSVSPANLNANESWDIIRIIMVCLGDGTSGPDPTPDLSSFFTTDAITNGIVLRSVNGITKNIFNAKDNFHLVSETYDLNFYSANRFGFFGTTTRRTFNGLDKNGVVIRLNAETNDSFELIVRDDLTDMEECHAVVQGHRVL